PLVLPQHSAIHHLADDIFSPDRIYAQFDQSIAEQDAGSRAEFARQVREAGRNSRGIAGDVPGRDRDRGTGLQQHGLMVLELAGADFWSLQVLQDAEGAPFALGGAPEALDITGVLLVSSVRKIKPRDV